MTETKKGTVVGHVGHDIREKPPEWDIRASIASVHGLETAWKYDKYLKEHRLRLLALERVARGDMAPSGEWYGK